MPIVNPMSGQQHGQLRVALAMGSLEQISAYQRTKAGSASAVAVAQRPANYLERCFFFRSHWYLLYDPCFLVQPLAMGKLFTHVPLSPSSINLVPAHAGKVTISLASHWPCVTNNHKQQNASLFWFTNFRYTCTAAFHSAGVVVICLARRSNFRQHHLASRHSSSNQGSDGRWRHVV